DIADPDRLMHRIRVPRLDLASVHDGQTGAQVVTADLSVDREQSGDTFYDLASQDPEEEVSVPAHVALIVGAELAAGFETNAVEDNAAGGEPAERGRDDTSRYGVTRPHEGGTTYG